MLVKGATVREFYISEFKPITLKPSETQISFYIDIFCYSVLFYLRLKSEHDKCILNVNVMHLPK